MMADKYDTIYEHQGHNEPLSMDEPEKYPVDEFRDSSREETKNEESLNGTSTHTISSDYEMMANHDILHENRQVMNVLSVEEFQKNRKESMVTRTQVPPGVASVMNDKKSDSMNVTVTRNMSAISHSSRGRQITIRTTKLKSSSPSPSIIEPLKTLDSKEVISSSAVPPFTSYPSQETIETLSTKEPEDARPKLEPKKPGNTFYVREGQLDQPIEIPDDDYFNDNITKQNSFSIHIDENSITHDELDDKISDVSSVEDLRNTMVHENNPSQKFLSFLSTVVSRQGTRFQNKRREVNLSSTSPDIPFEDQIEDFETNFLARCSTFHDPRIQRSNTSRTMRRKQTMHENLDDEKKKENHNHSMKRNITTMTQREDTLKKRAFIVKLAKYLVLYGAPTHRIEFQIEEVSNEFDIESSCIIFPGVVMITFGEEPDYRSSTHVVKSGGGFNMEKLSDLNQVCHDLVDRKIQIDEAGKKIDDIITRRKPKGFMGNPILSSKFMHLMAFPIHAFSLAMVAFRLTLIEAGVSALLAFCVSILVVIGEKYKSFLFLLDFSAALVVSFLGRVIQWAFFDPRGLNWQIGNDCFNFLNIVLSAISMLLPGLSLTLSMVEIATKNMVSGVVRMFNAFFTAIMLGFGMSIGSSLVVWTDISQKIEEDSNSRCKGTINWVWIAVFFFPLSLMSNFFFRAKLRQYPIMTFSSFCAIIVSILASRLLQNAPEAPAVLASFVVGLVSNIYARMYREPAMPPYLSGILMLVPGSLAVKSTMGFLGANLDGAQFAFQMITTGLSITVGLFVSSLMVWPTRPTIRKQNF